MKIMVNLPEMTPSDFVALFDKHVYGQEQAKKMLAIALRNRYRTSLLLGQDRFSVNKQNVLLHGPTGTGKTALIRVLRKDLELPVLEFDMTSFTESGYVGRSIEEIGKELRELTKGLKIPNWYLEAHGQPINKEPERKYTRAELEELQRQELRNDMQERDEHRKRFNEAYNAALDELKASGVLDIEKHGTYLSVYYYRCLLLGLYRSNHIEDVSGLQELTTLNIDGLDFGAVFKDTARLKELSDLENSDEELSEMGEAELEAEVAAIMARLLRTMGPIESEFIELGRRYMNSYPSMATAPHETWAQFADQFEESDDALRPIGFKAIRVEDPELHALTLLHSDIELAEKQLTTCDDFSHYVDDDLWVLPKFEQLSKEAIEAQEKSDSPKRRIDPKSFVENFAVVFLDEIDKLIEEDTTRTHVSRSGVQRSLLKMVEGGTYHGIDTTNILFVAAGAFAISPISKLMPELQGRFPLRGRLNALDADAFVHICKMTGSEFQGHIALMRTENVQVKYDMDTYQVIAERTLAQNMVDNLGARRLGAVINAIFQPAMYEPEKYRQNGFDIRGETLRAMSKPNDGNQKH
ncbi:putative heat shock protein [Erwinia phage vB_EamM_Kwan]|uniref:Putative heat shock protein n=1 Tax=Erwinia phage vB_EamM_Kwan TaxID=1883374 RepID=A0A1B2IDZ7_9CAUD|nr:putative heat shock protein [Erwinia phage vB_EamM_Kwan]ANZ49500.1 putative heat shock protein [Erwinia phage vB_EamM_Kwan]